MKIHVLFNTSILGHSYITVLLIVIKLYLHGTCYDKHMFANSLKNNRLFCRRFDSMVNYEAAFSYECLHCCLVFTCLLLNVERLLLHVFLLIQHFVLPSNKLSGSIQTFVLPS